MKKAGLFLMVILFISTVSSFQKVIAQDQTKEEQENDKIIQQKIEQQKKALLELKKAQDLAEQSLLDQQSALDSNLKDIRVEVESSGRSGDALRMFGQRGDRTFRFDEPFDFPSEIVPDFYLHSGVGDSERTTWDYSKSVKEKTFSKDYTFDVEKTVKTVVMSVMGDCKAGDIHIKIVMPNGKNYSDVVIDEAGNLNWRKSFTISETENQDKTGEWKFQIASEKATGFFKISFQTY